MTAIFTEARPPAGFPACDAASVAPARGASGDIRPFHPDDATAVAGLFWRVFRRRPRPAPHALAAYFAEAFHGHPWADPELPSRVFVRADGTVRGFIGVLPVRMALRGRPVRAAVASSMVVENPAEDPMAGARLLRAFLEGGQDLSLSETSNLPSEQMWLRLGGRLLSAHSLGWTRVLRPAGHAVTRAGAHTSAVHLLRPIAAALDPVLARWTGGEPASAAEEGADVAPEELACIVPDIVRHFTLHPDFDAPSLRWLLSHAARKEQHGAPIARILYDRKGRPAGGYLAHFQPGGVLRLVQIFARPAQAEVVLGDILAQAWRRGAVAVSGRNQPELMHALLPQRCVFRPTGSMLVHAPSPEPVDAILRGDAFVNGLAGEGWIRLLGGAFE